MKQRSALADGTALSGSALITGLIGLACWLLAAATLPQAAVGAASAFVSGFLLVAGLAQLSVGLGMLRWLPRSGRAAGRLVRRGYLLVGVTAAAGAGVFLLLPYGHVADQVAGEVAGGVGPALFVLACVSWALFQLQDSVLAALGKARWVPVFNGAFGVVRIAALPVLGGAFGALGVVLSWAGPTMATMLAVLAVIAGLVVRRRPDGPAVLPAPSEAVGYLAPTYLATIGTTVLYNSVPLLVEQGYGARYGATFFVIWTGLNTVDYALNGFVNSLVLRGSHDPAGLPDIVRTVGSRLLLVVAAAAAVGELTAPVLLGLFGREYAVQGATALRVLLAGIVVRVAVAMAVGAALAAGRSRRAATIQLASTGLVLAGVLLVPHSLGLTGPTAGFLAAQCVVAAAVTPMLWRLLRRQHRYPPAPLVRAEERV